MRVGKVVILDYSYLGEFDLFKTEKEAFEKNGIGLVFAECKTEEDIIDVANDADMILCCGNPPITEKVISSLVNCKAIVRYGIGVNSVDLKAATKFGKIVYNMPGFCAEELVIHASALILNLLRNVTFYDSSIREGNWPKAKGSLPKRLSNLEIGLYGFGASARPMAQVFKDGFGSSVMAFDPYVSKNIFDECGVKSVSFEELLSKADVISIHAPLNSQTRHIFNRDAFTMMKSNAMIINISRGPLINEKDLIDALSTGEIKYAGLDVFEEEPIKSNNPLLKMKNVVLTPHSAFYGEESMENQHLTSAKLVIETLIHKKIVKENVANRDVISNEE